MNEFKEVFRAKATGTSPLKPLEADASFAYAVGRALTYFPNTNQNQAAFVEHSFKNTVGMSEVIGTEKGFTYGLVNANHSVGPGKANHVLGTIRSEANIPGVGIDIMAQIDKRACEAFEISPDEIASGDYSDISIEIFCDRDKSTFVAITEPGAPLEKQKAFTSEEAAAIGMRRTRWGEPDPYLYEGHVVVELCSPIRCRGVALVPDPADKTANVFEVAASMEVENKKDFLTAGSGYADPGFRSDGKKRYPLDTREHAVAALSFWGNAANREPYTSEQRDHITKEIQDAKKHFGIGDDEHSGFSSVDMPSVTPMASAYDDDDSSFEEPSGDLPNDAYADTYFNPEEDADERRFPLYASAKSFADGVPHRGMVKAALQAHAGGRMKNPSQALQRLQVAHSQLHGAKSMEQAEKLATEVAELKTKLAEIQASQEQAATEVSAKDAEIASLTEQVKTLSEEKAALEAAAQARDAEERASVRFAKLAAVEGFAVKDEEKAELIETLKGEDELAFELRVARATISSLEAAAKKNGSKKAEEQASTEEEEASLHNAALLNLDFIPKSVSSKPEIKFEALI